MRILYTPEVGKLIRAYLKATHPNVKFSVRKDGWNSIRIHYGPTNMVDRRALETDLGRFSGGGFDGMIDMSYSWTNWLTRDGQLHYANCRGTEGQRGSVPSFSHPAPSDDAEEVSVSPRYITVNCY